MYLFIPRDSSSIYACASSTSESHGYVNPILTGNTIQYIFESAIGTTMHYRGNIATCFFQKCCQKGYHVKCIKFKNYFKPFTLNKLLHSVKKNSIKKIMIRS